MKYRFDGYKSTKNQIALTPCEVSYISAEKQVAEALEILNHISEDSSVPRNIRRAATQSIEILKDESMELPVRAINAIDLLEEITNDTNCPYHARTMLWQVTTRLELPSDDDDEWEDWDDDEEY